MGLEEEKDIVRKLVELGLKNGATFVSVHDGGAWCLNRALTVDKVMESVASTDMDTIRFRDANDKYLGQFDLVWGNGEDVISDHSDNEWCNQLWTIGGFAN